MSLSALFHEMPPRMRTLLAQRDSACRAIHGNHKRLSSTSRMFVGRMEAKLEGLAQSCLRLLNAAFHHREYLNSANPESATAAPRRQPPQVGCLPESRAPKDRGLPSPHPSDPLRHNPKLVWRFFGRWIRTIRPGLAPSALRNTLPEFLATAAKTAILVKFIGARLDLSTTGGRGLPRAGPWPRSPICPLHASVRHPCARLDPSGTERITLAA